MPPGSRRALLAVLSLLAITGTVAVGTAIAGGADAPLAQQEPPTDFGNESTTAIELSLQSDGDARWTITQEYNVTSAVERTAFETLANRFEAEQTAQLGLPAYRLALDRVEPTVDRSMEITAVDRQSSVEDGTLSLSFTWTNFARENNETRIVDDAFTTRQGTWFDSIGPAESLIIELPRGSPLDTPKPLTGGTMRWDGSTQFEPGYLDLSYTANPPLIPPMVWGVLVAVLVFAIVGLIAGYLLTQRRDGISIPDVPLGGDESSTSGGTVGSGTAGGDTGPPAGTDAASGTGADSVEDGEDDGDDGVDLSLLSDEERVEYLIEQNGGRMKQANIVKETGWSNAKVSQLLSAMEEDGRITKLRIGRENLISFPDEDIGDFEEP